MYSADYLMVHEEIKESFVAEVEKAIREMYGEDHKNQPTTPGLYPKSHGETCWVH